MRLIATKNLRKSDVPVVDPEILDYGQDPRWQLQPLWLFALSFDGYRYFGADDGASDRLGLFAQSVERDYHAKGRLAPLGEIGMFRACLFWEQRDWCKWGRVEAEMTRADVGYFGALVDAVRSRLT